MTSVNVRYIVADVDAAIGFCAAMLGFKVEMHPGPGFARLSRGSLHLLLNRPVKVPCTAAASIRSLRRKRHGSRPPPGMRTRMQLCAASAAGVRGRPRRAR
jgi:hypothetical protein